MRRILAGVLLAAMSFEALAGAPEIKPLNPYQAEISRQGIFPVEKKGLWGYVDVKGKTLIKPMFESATEFDRYGLSVVGYDGKKGLVGRNCRYVLEPCFDEIGPFDSHKLSYVKDGGKTGLITINGKTVVPVEFDSISVYTPEGYAFVVKNGRKGTVNWKGETRVPVEYEVIKDFNESLFLVTKSGKSGLLTHAGEVKLPVEYEQIVLHGSGRFYVTEKNGRYGVLTKGGSVHCDEAYEFIHPECINDVILVRKDGRMGAVNGDFGYKIVLFFDELSWPEGCTDYLISRDEATGLYGAVTLDGKKILDCVFSDAPVLGDEPKLLLTSGRYLLADKRGSISLSQADDDLFAACGGDLQAYVDDRSIPQSVKKHLPGVDVNVEEGDVIEYRTEWSDFSGMKIGGCGLWNATRGVWKLRPVYECPDGDYIKCGDWAIGVFKDGKASVGYRGDYVTIDENGTITK